MHLESGPWSADLAPDLGASFTGIAHAGRELLYAPKGAFWMMPWTNRLDGGRFGRTACLPVNDAEEGNALHGLSRGLPWQVEEAAPDRAVLVQEVSHAPFHYAARLEIMLAPGAFSIALNMRNAGEAPCPMGFGWHPWFLRPAGTTVRFHAEATFRRNERNLPIAVVPAEGVSGGEETWLNTDGHFAGWDGVAELRRPDLALLLRAEGDWSRNLQFYAPDRWPTLCLEPVSHVPDVINRPQFAPWGAMRVLAPGESLQGRVTLSVA